MSPLLFPFVHYYLFLINDSFGSQEKILNPIFYEIETVSFFERKLKLFPMNSL
jgi:hypothetical protein